MKREPTSFEQAQHHARHGTLIFILVVVMLALWIAIPPTIILSAIGGLAYLVYRARGGKVK
jgi:uncharacterized membrane protein YdjX (TVP38/TMEM64 family)